MVNFEILIILHLLGDFYLQTAKLAKCKGARIDNECKECKKCKRNAKINYRYLFVHTALYCIPFAALFFMMKPKFAVISIIIIFISHGIIDSLSSFFGKKSKQIPVFAVDQILHIGILVLIYRLLTFNAIFDGHEFTVKTVLTILLLIAPSSIIINKLFEDIYPKTKNNGIFDVGSIIGILERVLVIIFAYFENFPAIAIVITVKTWARTNDLKETEFRNKYLLGTLASLVLALCCYLIFRLL